MYRKERLGDLLLGFIAEQVRELNDPRLQFVTITEVRVAKDFRSAKVFWTVPALATNSSPEGGIEDSLTSANETSPQTTGAPARENFPDDGQRARTNQALDGVKGMLKRRIGEELRLRYVPDLFFSYDESAQQGSRIDELLKKIGY